MRKCLTLDEVNTLKPSNSRLTAIEDIGSRILPCGSKRRFFAFKCICGNITEAPPYAIKAGHILSCGCLLTDFCKSVKRNKYFPIIPSLNGVYNKMVRRCYNPLDRGYRFYGAKGVRVDQRWLDSYQYFLDWSLANGWQKGLQLDKDKLGDGLLYGPETCSWVTREENMKYLCNSKKFLYLGEKMSLSEISSISNISYDILYHRIMRGRSVEDAINFKKIK